MTHAGGRNVTARVREVTGKQATIVATSGRIDSSSIKRVTTVGKDPLTGAEKGRLSILFCALDGTVSLKNSAFQRVWCLQPQVLHDITPLPTVPSSVSVPLNLSQALAVRKAAAPPLLDDTIDVQLIFGPPGTGKTSVIAACVQALRSQNRNIWLVAQSNVAVKVCRSIELRQLPELMPPQNIAEKLAQVNFWDFKILVSHEFHFDWELLPPSCLSSDCSMS